jgi:hypothetical protein
MELDEKLNLNLVLNVTALFWSNNDVQMPNNRIQLSTEKTRKAQV